MSIDAQTQGVSDAPDMDYTFLRQEGLTQLERLAGSGWTDFNEHDPGITILEQYCYALSDLGYRCDFPLPDLLCREGKDPYASLFSPARILASRAVTLADLRKLAIDVPGVRNAWIEKIDYAAPPLLHAGGAILIPQSSDEVGDPVNLKGLYRVLIEYSDDLGGPPSDVISRVAERLHAHRPLCMDFDSVKVMETQAISVKARIEIRADGNPEDILVAIYSKLAAHVSPSVPFYTLAERQAAGLSTDEIFDGPGLEHGFIDTDELLRMERKTALRVSDLIHEIMNVDGVLLVRQLTVSGNGGVDWLDWVLELRSEEAPALDGSNSELILERRQVALNVDSDSAWARFQETQTTARQPATAEELDILPPPGRERGVGRYYSAQHQFPANYALGEHGLPLQADAQHRGQVKQLQAYLLFFDQLLANQFAQLAHVGELLGFDEESPSARTYFSTDIDDPSLGLDAVWVEQDSDARSDYLSAIVDNPAAADDSSAPSDWSRKQRFLDHMLARFAEQFIDPAQYLVPTPLTTEENTQQTEKEKQQQSLANDKQAWLRNFPELSKDRGTGFDTLAANNPVSGLEQRLRLKLGLASLAPDEQLYLVEHVLLRPVDADKGQSSPLLAEASSADPYSLQISLVFPAWPDPYKEGSSFRRFVEQTVREETPAHLVVYIRWLSKDDMAAFEAAWQTWRNSQGLLREGNEDKSLRLLEENGPGIELRDARDRLIDLLAMGHTYPLADLPVGYNGEVTAGQCVDISVASSQTGVLYQLLDKNGNPLEPPVNATGNGKVLVLKTPSITADISFTIKAIKDVTKLYVMLKQAISIVVVANPP